MAAVDVLVNDRLSVSLQEETVPVSGCSNRFPGCQGSSVKLGFLDSGGIQIRILHPILIIISQPIFKTPIASKKLISLTENYKKMSYTSKKV